MAEQTKQQKRPEHQNEQRAERRKLKDGDQDWKTKCCVCGAVPTVHPMGLCGPCCFGEAATAGGDW
jgi:hypothetical protein